LWIQFDLGLAHLAAGRLEDARAAYKGGVDTAARLVAEARAAKKAAPFVVRESLDDAGQSLDSLAEVLEGDGKEPPKAQVAQPQAVLAEIKKLIPSVKELAVALEYGGVPPAGPLTARIGPPRFAAFSANDTVAEAETDSFPEGIHNVALRYDYSEIEPGQTVVVKTYANYEEDPSCATWGPGTRPWVRTALPSSCSPRPRAEPGMSVAASSAGVRSRMRAESTATLPLPMTAARSASRRIRAGR
jgi:hypothetical protein